MLPMRKIIFSHTIFEAGAEIPSTLLYTDAAGETTCYVPIDAFSQALGMETKQVQDSPIVTVHLPYELMSYGLKTDMEGTTYGDVLEEIAPVPGVSGKTLLKETHYQEKDAVTTVMKPVRGNGDYVSITVTNHGKQALEFGIGTTKDGNSIGSVLSQAPAGKTVTRTVKILDMQKAMEEPIAVYVGSVSRIQSDVDATISAVQFKSVK